MKLTFARKVYLGYIALIAGSMIIGLYAITQLYLLNQTVRAAVTQYISAQQILFNLQEAFLSQTKIEKELQFHANPGLRDQFDRFTSTFQTHLDRLKTVTDLTQAKDAVERLIPLYHEFTLSITTDASEPGKTDLLARFIRDEIGNLKMIYRQGLQNHALIFDRQVRKARETMLWLPLLLTLGGIAIIHTFISLTRKPLRQVREAIKEMVRGNIVQTLPVVADDEIGDLVSAFNQLTWRLQRLDHLKEDFISNLSHELRTPLTSLQEANNLLLEEVSGRLNERQRQLLLIIQDDTKRLLHLTTNLLELSRMRAGMLPLLLEPCNVEELVSDTMEAMRPLARKKGLGLDLVAKHSVDPILIDTTRIRQVIINLLSNAIKFTPEAGRISLRIQKASSRELQISIADTGCGISKDDMEKIFDRFYTDGGFGLGLPIAKQIILAHGGKMWVESEPGKGSVFSFTLPAKDAKFKAKEAVISAHKGRNYEDSLTDNPPVAG